MDERRQAVARLMGMPPSPWRRRETVAAAGLGLEGAAAFSEFVKAAGRGCKCKTRGPFCFGPRSLRDSACNLGWTAVKSG